MKRLCPKDKLRFEGFEGSLCPECEAESLPDLEGVVVAGRYELSSYLGIGGMRAPVYQAIQISTRRRVAIKLLPIRDEKTVSRFEREARIASKLNHRHITIVHDYGQMDDAHMFLVMEFLKGTSLQDLLKRESSLTIIRSLNIISMILRGLEHAHNHAVVHRDLKPDNVFLVQQDEEMDFAKILDFGIAKHFGDVPADSGELALETLTQETVLCGTPLYMAPEQITQESFDARIDIYAVGIVLFQLLTGRLPFVGRTSYEILSKHLAEPAPLLTQVRPDQQFPPALVQLCAKAMSKKPHARFQSAREMRQAIRLVRRSLGAITADTDNVPFADALPSPAESVGTQPLTASEIPAPQAPAPRTFRYGLVAGLLLLLATTAVAAVWMLQGDAPTEIESSSKTARRDMPTVLDEDSPPPSTPAVHTEQIQPSSTAVGEATPPPSESHDKPQPTPVSEQVIDGASRPSGTQAGAALAATGSMLDERPKTAQLRLESSPTGGMVTLDGARLGTTPVSTDLLPGRYAVSIAVEGHVTYATTITITSGDTGNVLMKSVMLAKAPPPQAQATTEASKASPPKPGARKESTKSAKRRKSDSRGKNVKVTRTKPAETSSTTESNKKPSHQSGKKPQPDQTTKPAAAATKPAAEKPDSTKPKPKKPRIKILGGGSDKPKIKVLR